MIRFLEYQMYIQLIRIRQWKNTSAYIILPDETRAPVDLINTRQIRNYELYECTTL